jgi:hypothetical protein
MKNKITIKDFMECVKYKLDDGGKYGWDCYGFGSFSLDFYNHKKGSVSIVFDTKDQTVYELSVCDYVKNVAFKWINKNFIEKHNRELKKRGYKEDQAWDEVNYQLVNIEQIIKIAKTIANRK